MWTTADTVAVIAAGAAVAAAAAQISAAIFTAVMAKRTHTLATKTEDMATATKAMAVETGRAADAAVVEARATEALAKEAQLDRQLSWSPALRRVRFSGTVGRDASLSVAYREYVTLANLGQGQAFDCLYVSRHDGHSWCFTRITGIAGGEALPKLECWPGRGAPPWELLEPSPNDQDQTARFMAVLVCEDVFGNRIRFPVGRSGRDVCQPTDAHPPAWATSEFAWSQRPDRPEGTDG